MEQIKYFLIMVLTIPYHNSSASPVTNVYEEQDPELQANFFEGDMDINISRNFLKDPSQRWPNGVVYYKLDKIFDVDHTLHILKAMKNIESVSCIRFFPAADTTKAYLRITGNPKMGCSSEVGYSGRKQTLNLAIDDINKGCFKNGSILHEFLHSLGFVHQHSAPDRDDYILIVKENIIKGMQFNFNKLSSKTITDLDVGYDYDSVMHYSDKAFTKNGKKTIIPLENENIKIGQRRYLSEKDILKLNKMYECKVPSLKKE